MAHPDVTLRSKRTDWNTPACVLELVRKLGPIGLDPCSNEGSIVAAAECFDDVIDGLGRPWFERGLVYVNPPYGREIAPWVERCATEGMGSNGTEIVALLPARVDTAWFQDAWTAAALCFWRGRLTFLGAPAPAPFPSVVAYWGPRFFDFAAVFQHAGKVVFP